MSRADGGASHWQRWAEEHGDRLWLLWSEPLRLLGQPVAGLEMAFGTAWRLLAEHLPELARAYSGAGSELAPVFEQIRSQLGAAAEPPPLEPPLDELLALASRYFHESGLSSSFGALPTPALHAARLPQLGMFQHRQRRFQEALESLEDYRQARQAYTQLIEGVVAEALDRTRRQLQRLKHERRSLQGLRPLYELWLEAAESAYEECVAGEPYAEAFGRLSNQQIATARALHNIAEDLLRGAGLPSREALRETQLHIHQLRREQRELAAELRAERALRVELEELRADLRALAEDRSGRRE